MNTERAEDVLGFWFPSQPSTEQAAVVRQWEWWFCGGANAADITEHFSPLLEQATRGELSLVSHAHGWR